MKEKVPNTNPSKTETQIRPRVATIYTVASVLGGMALEKSVREGNPLEIPAIDNPPKNNPQG